MNFLNEPVPTESLPRVEAVPLQPLEPAYRKVLRIQSLIVMVVLAVIAVVLLAFIEKFREPLAIGITAGVWLLVAAARFYLIEKSYVHKGYAIRDRDIIYRSGWFIRRTQTCPFNRIQHSTVSMGPLERAYGLATLMLYTAGSGAADMNIPGLTQETAQSLKEWINKKIADEPAEAI